jgi:hypothetical protein
MYERSVVQFERQQRRIEREHSELLQRVSRLTDEVSQFPCSRQKDFCPDLCWIQVVLEKRLGIAQLCLLLAVLVFMALTRGSRNEPVRQAGSEGGAVRSRTSSLRGWGRRTLSISGDWMNRFTSRSVSPSGTRKSESSTAENERPPGKFSVYTYRRPRLNDTFDRAYHQDRDFPGNPNFGWIPSQ